MKTADTAEAIAQVRRDEHVEWLYVNGATETATGDAVGLPRSTVARILDQRGVKRRPKGQFTGTGQYIEWVPWPIAYKHRNNYDVIRLRWYAQLRANESGQIHKPLSTEAARMLRRWMERLDRPSEDAPYGYIVCSYTVEEGIKYCPRKRSERGSYVLRPDGTCR